MKRFRLLPLLTVIALIINISQYTLCQVPNCPPIKPECAPWSSWTPKTWDLNSPDCHIAIEYRKRVCQPGNVEELEYRIISVSGNCTQMQNLDIMHYKLNSLNEFIDILFLEELANSNNYKFTDCSTGGKLTRKFYTATCGVFVKCTYNITASEPICDQGYDLPAPDYTQGGTRKVDVYKWQSCGEACCERVYNVCVTPAGTTASNIRIELLQRNKLGNCTQEPGGISPKYDKPCESGC